jgi:hypothetical protein
MSGSGEVLAKVEEGRRSKLQGGGKRTTSSTLLMIGRVGTPRSWVVVLYLSGLAKANGNTRKVLKGRNDAEFGSRRDKRLE